MVAQISGDIDLKAYLADILHEYRFDMTIKLQKFTGEFTDFRTS